MERIGKLDDSVKLVDLFCDGLWRANAAQMEVNDAVSAFLGNGPKNIEYAPNDPFALFFQNSAGMDAINAKITANCSTMSGKVGVGSGEAFVNTLIDGVAGGQGFNTPEAQLGAFNATYSRDSFTVSAAVTNPISLNSAAYHATSAMGIKNPSSGPLGAFIKPSTSSSLVHATATANEKDNSTCVAGSKVQNLVLRCVSNARWRQPSWVLLGKVQK